jgi:hypothetical protein
MSWKRTCDDDMEARGRGEGVALGAVHAQPKRVLGRCTPTPRTRTLHGVSTGGHDMRSAPLLSRPTVGAEVVGALHVPIGLRVPTPAQSQIKSSICHPDRQNYRRCNKHISGAPNNHTSPARDRSRDGRAGAYQLRVIHSCLMGNDGIQRTPYPAPSIRRSVAWRSCDDCTRPEAEDRGRSSPREPAHGQCHHK